MIAAAKLENPPAIGAIYSPLGGQVKNGEIVVFPVICRELPLFEGEGTDI